MCRATGTERATPAAGDRALEDLEELEDLIERHGDAVRRYCRWMLGATDGEDAAQTVFAQAAVAGAGRVEIANPRAWLLGVARHRCLDLLRAARQGPRLLAHDQLAALIESRPDDASRPADPRVHAALAQAVDQLDARSRRLLVLRFHDGLSYDEIGAQVADSPGALRVRLVRALAILRSRLARQGVGP